MSQRVQRFALVATAAMVAVAGTIGSSIVLAGPPPTLYVSYWRGFDSNGCTGGRSSTTPLQNVEFALGCAGNGDTIYIEALDSQNFIYYPATTLVVANKVTMIGTGPNFVLTSAQYPAIDGRGLFRVLENQSANTTISNLELDNGLADKGGGIWNHPRSAALTLNGALVYGNSAKFGGGIYNEGTLTATNSTISTNIATGDNIGECTIGGGITGRGGGIYNDGTSSNTAGNLTLSQVSIIANTATSAGCADGGGIFNDSGSVTLNMSSSVTGNKAWAGYDISTGQAVSTAGAGGGGIANFGGNLIVNGSSVDDNAVQCYAISSCATGAGLDNVGGTLTVLNNASVSGNASLDGVVSRLLGGGIYNSNRATVDFYPPVTITNNMAAQGGGIYNYGLAPVVGTVTFHKTQVGKVTRFGPGNSPDDCGGTGIYHDQGQATSLPGCPNGP